MAGLDQAASRNLFCPWHLAPRHGVERVPGGCKEDHHYYLPDDRDLARVCQSLF